MSPIERRLLLLDRLRTDGKFSLNQIAEELNVSSMTIRRDLRLLEDQGIATISAGIAHYVEGANLSSLRQSSESSLQSAQKVAIGRMAAGFVEDGDTIIVDCGSTTLQLLKFLELKRLTIITNSLPVASVVGANSSIRLIFVPGEYSSDSKGMSGPLAVDFFHNIRADKAFIGASGFDAKGGVNEPVLGDATTKRAMLESARTSYLLVDASKYGNVHFMAMNKLSDYSCVITDSSFPQDKRAELEAACNQVIYA